MVLSIIALLVFLAGLFIYFVEWTSPKKGRIQTIGLVVAAIAFFYLMAGFLGGPGAALDIQLTK